MTTVKQYTVRYEETEQGWVGHCDEIRWSGGTWPTIDKMREKAKDGLEFTLERPLRSVMFMQTHRSPRYVVSPDAQETFSVA